MRTKRPSSTRGEIATILTLLSLGAIFVGTIIGVQPTISNRVRTIFSRAASNPSLSCPYKTTATVYIETQDAKNILTKEQMLGTTWGVYNDKQGKLFPAGVFGDTGVFFRDNKSEPLDGLGTRYKPGDRASVTLEGIQDNPYWKIKSQFCTSSTGAEVNGCPSDFDLQSKSPAPTIRNFYVNCGVDLNYGWVLTSTGVPLPTPTPEPITPTQGVSPIPTVTVAPTLPTTTPAKSCACNGTAPGPIRVCNQTCETNGTAGEPCNSDAICNRKVTATPPPASGTLTPPISPTGVTPTPSQKRSHELDVTSDTNNADDLCFKVVDTNGKTHEPSDRSHCKTAACINPNGSIGKIIVDYTHHTGRDESLTITWKQNTCENKVIGELDGPGKNECRELLNTASRFTLPRRKTVRCIWEDPKARGTTDDIPDCRILGSKDSTDPKTLCPVVPPTETPAPTVTESPTPTASPTATITPTPTPSRTCTELKAGGPIRVVFIPSADSVSQDTVKADSQKAIGAFMSTNLGLARTKYFSFYQYTGDVQNYLKNMKLTDFAELVSYDNLDSEKLASSAGTCNATIPVLVLYGNRFDSEYKTVSEFGLNKPIIITSYALGLNPMLLTHQIGHSFQLRDQFQYNKGLSDEFKAQNLESGYNCDTASTCSKWASKPYSARIQCTAVCGLAEWFRPSINSIMNHEFETSDFDSPSLEGLDLEMDAFLKANVQQTGSFQVEKPIPYGVVAVNLKEQDGEFAVESVSSKVGYPSTYSTNKSGSSLSLSVQNGGSTLYTTQIEPRSPRLLESGTDPKNIQVDGISTTSRSFIAYIPYFTSADSLIVSDTQTGKKTRVLYDTYQVQKPATPPTMCGNGICDSIHGETVQSCAIDCKSTDTLRKKGADVNYDGKVRANDYALCIKRLGEKGSKLACDPDINGSTDARDISILLKNLDRTIQ